MSDVEPGSGRGAFAVAPGTPETPFSAGEQALPPLRWKMNAVFFAATALSVLLTGAARRSDWLAQGGGWLGVLRSLSGGWSFALPLLAILLSHELGHFIAARIHRVDASLPYFIPLPFISPFGTMGAVINMRGRIRSRDALLDIGASGPLAGLCVAVPVLIVGLMQSPVLPNAGHGWQEGQCLLYIALKRVILGPIPPGYDVQLTPMAFAGWAGLFVTMINLVAVSQLDGGHIAYALFGPRQNRYARVLHASVLLVFAYDLLRFMGPLVARREWSNVASGFFSIQVLFWLLWYLVIRVVMRAGGRDHPPTEPGELHPVRKALAVLSLVVFALLFMPTPLAAY